LSHPIFIGIDAGTSKIKCVAFGLDGSLIGSRECDNDYQLLDDGGAEQDPLDTRQKVIATLTDLVTTLGTDAASVCAIAITAQGDGLLLTDTQGEALHNGWLWLDSRAASIASEIERAPGYDTLFKQTGTAINAAQMRTQMRWLDRHQPELLDRAHSALHWKDYLYQSLTGVRATDPSEALFTFGDMASGGYSTDVLNALELTHRSALLPPIVDGLQHSDALLESIATQIGLPGDTPVVLGFVDVICSALGGGLYNRGQPSAMSILGTTGIHMRYAGGVDKLELPRDKTGYTIAFPGGGFVQLQTNMAATLNLDWLLSLGCEATQSLGHSASLDHFYAVLDKNLGDTTTVSALYHPYIASAGERGPFFNTDARASFIGLDQQSGFYSLARSVIEGLAFAARDCFEALGELPEEIRLTGGAAKSVAIRQIFASVMNRPVREVEQDESAAAGAAMMAAVNRGCFPSIDACVEQWLGDALGATTSPDQTTIAHYRMKYQIYLDYRKRQPSTWSALSALRDNSRTSN